MARSQESVGSALGLCPVLETGLGGAALVGSEQPAMFERVLTREQALSRFFTPKPKNEQRGRRQVEKLVPMQGGRHMAYLRPTTSFINPQMRVQYDSDHITGLGRSMRETYGGQLQNGGVALVSEPNIDAFLADLNDFFETDVKKEDIPEHPKFGVRVITIFGHNRQLGAAASNLAENGHPDKGMLVEVKAYKDPEFYQVLEMQAVENNGIPPAIYHRSRHMVQYMKLRKRDGNPASLEEVARKFRVDSDQVWRAQKFESLPTPIKELVIDEELPYSGAIELERLFKMYSEEDVTELAEYMAAKNMSSKQVIDEVKKREIARGLTPEIAILVDRGALTLPQARELERLNTAGLSGSLINEKAQWIALMKPPIEKIRSSVSLDIQNLRSQGASLLDAEIEGLNDEQRHAIAEQNRLNTLRGNIQSSLRSIRDKLDGLTATIDTGMLGELSEANPIAKELASHRDTIKRLTDMAGATSLSPELLTEILESIRALVTESSGNSEIAGILESLDGVVALEAISDRATQEERAREIRARLTAAVGSSSLQGSLL